jgi:hypothetical protein
MKVVSILILSLVGSITLLAQPKAFTQELMQDACTFDTTGRNRYFILEPGYRLVLEDKRGGRLVITVLNEIQKVGGVDVRVVEENESENGQTTEISRNFFAVCRENGGVYYFGEEVDIYKDGRVVKHEGAWLAGGKNRAGLLMPGLPLLGARYFQEIAPGVAMDRAEVLSVSETRETPAGRFTNCLMTEESSQLAPGKELKYYAPDIGLIQEEDLVLKSYGKVRLP